LYNSSDEREFVSSIELVCQNEYLRQRLGRAAMIHAQEHYDAKKNAKETFELYEQLLSM